MLIFKWALGLAVFSWIAIWACRRMNDPYPWNSNLLDCLEGLSILVFIPAALTAIGRGIWLI